MHKSKIISFSVFSPNQFYLRLSWYFFLLCSVWKQILLFILSRKGFPSSPIPPPSKLPESIPILLITAWKTQPRAINRSEEEKSTANGLAENLLVLLCAAFQPQQTHLFEKLICWNWYSCMFEICADSDSLSLSDVACLILASKLLELLLSIVFFLLNAFIYYAHKHTHADRHTHTQIHPFYERRGLFYGKQCPRALWNVKSSS